MKGLIITVFILSSLSSLAQRFNVRFEVDGVEQKITEEYKFCFVVYDSLTRIIVNYKKMNRGELIFPEFVKKYEHCHIMLLTPNHGIIGPHDIYPEYGDDRIQRLNIDTTDTDFEYLGKVMYRTFKFGVDKKPFDKNFLAKKYIDNPSLMWRTQYIVNNINYPEIVQISHFLSKKEWRKRQKYLKGYFYEVVFSEIIPNYNRNEEDEE
jgi:hypothetical protein